MKMNQNIILYGLGGCGKTTAAKALHRLGFDVYDIDFEVFVLTGKTPAEIVMHEGEASFRAYEKTVVRALAEKTGSVISVGAGTILDDENLTLLKQNGFFVYLNRLKPSEDEKMTDRFFLSCADMTVSEPTADEAARTIVNRLKNVNFF